MHTSIITQCHGKGTRDGGERGGWIVLVERHPCSVIWLSLAGQRRPDRVPVVPTALAAAAHLAQLQPELLAHGGGLGVRRWGDAAARRVAGDAAVALAAHVAAASGAVESVC